MGKKYQLTENQLRVVVKHVKRDNHLEQLDEGWKEVALGAAMLLGSTFGGNKVVAQKANDAINKTEILTKIKNTLENEDGKTELAKFLKMSPEKLNNYLNSNADKVEDDFNKVSKKKNLNISLNISDGKNTRSSINSKIKQGFSVSDIKVEYDTILEPGDVVFVQDTIDFTYSDSDMFMTGKYELKPEVSNELKETIETIKSIGGEIVGVNVESSTDKEPISVGNDVLAKNRANSVIKILKGMGVSGDMNIKTLPNQGPDVYKKGMDKQERLSYREKTKSYRYVKVSFIVVMSEPVQNQPEPLYKVNKRIEVKMVRTGVYGKGTPKKISGKTSKQKYNGKCLKVKKGKGPSVKCHF